MALLRSSNDAVNWAAGTAIIIRDPIGDLIYDNLSTRDLKYVNGLLIGSTTGSSSISTNGKILTSADGLNWSERLNLRNDWKYFNSHDLFRVHGYFCISNIFVYKM